MLDILGPLWRTEGRQALVRFFEVDWVALELWVKRFQAYLWGVKLYPHTNLSLSSASRGTSLAALIISNETQIIVPPNLCTD